MFVKKCYKFYNEALLKIFKETFMALFLSVMPIVLLIYLMVKKNALPSYIALPLTALIIYFIQKLYFGTSFTLLHANVVKGVISTLTPITIIFGAILFNRFMEVSGAMDTLRKWLGNISSNPVAQLMIIGWAFAFMVEGASGFGTPAAIAAPILVGLGFHPLKVALLALVMNSVPVSFGAVGTPTWFGFGPFGLTESQILEIGSMTALMHTIAAFIIPLIALRLAVTWKEIRANIVFIYVSILACVIPYILIAQVNYEFPSLIAGAIGLLVSVLVANTGFGLEKTAEGKKKEQVSFFELFKASAPTGMLIGILVITRIKQLPFKAMLTNGAEWISTNLGYFGDFTISKGLVFKLANIFDTGVSGGYKLLYVPALIPFVVTVLLSFVLYPKAIVKVGNIFGTTLNQVKKPFLALLGALVMVAFMKIGGAEQDSMVTIIGKGLANTTGEYWQIFASYLGAVGAFFSGSNTVSNLTFGGMQMAAATSTGLSVTLVLALQSVGGAMGNMVCLNNIIAVSTVVGLEDQEGNIIKKTFVPMFIYGIIAALCALFVIPLFFNV